MCRMLLSRAVVLGLLSLFSTRPTNGQQFRSTFTSGPSNTAALVGTESVLNCSATVSTGDYLTWSFLDTTTLTTYTRIYRSPGTDVLPGYGDKYSIDMSSTGGYYNLIIPNTDATVATQYECALVFNDTKSYASVVAVEDVQCPDAGMEVIAGSETLALCSVMYHSAVQIAVLTPSLTWSAAEGNDAVILQLSPEVNNTYVGVVMNVTLEAVHDQQNFTCELSFTGTRAPTYTASCETFFNVLHGVSEITIEPNITDGEQLTVGTVITCTANGRPAPSIVWVDSNGNATVSENETLTVDESMVGTDPVTFICQATNQVENDTYTAEKSITFIAVEISVQPVASAGVETWVIVVAVVVPVVVLAAAGIAGYFIYRHHQKKKANKNKYTGNGRGPAAPTAATTAASRNSDPAENRPFFYQPNPQPAPRSVNGDVNYQPNGQPRPGSTSGFADLGTAAPNGSGPMGGSQYGGSTSRIASPAPMSYPYTGPMTTSLAGGGPGSVMGSQRGLPAMTAGAPAATYAPSTGRMTPANVNMQPNPVNYPYSGPSRQLSNASSVSRGSSYHGGSQQMQPPPLSYPPARSAASSHNSSLV